MIMNCSISPESLSIQCLQDEIQRKSPKYKTSAGLKIKRKGTSHQKINNNNIITY